MTPLVFAVRRRFGTWAPLIIWAALGQIVQLIIYRSIAPNTLVSARRQLYEKRRALKEEKQG